MIMHRNLLISSWWLPKPLLISTILKLGSTHCGLTACTGFGSKHIKSIQMKEIWWKLTVIWIRLNDPPTPIPTHYCRDQGLCSLQQFMHSLLWCKGFLNGRPGMNSSFVKLTMFCLDCVIVLIQFCGYFCVCVSGAFSSLFILHWNPG